MRISKTQFINYIRDLKLANSNFKLESEESLDLLMELENNNKAKVLLDSMYEDSKISLEEEQLKMMQPYYEHLEMLSGKAIFEKFSGEVIFNMNTFMQKRFSYFYQGIEFFCFLDGYQEDAFNVRIFETKTTTSRKFLDNYTFKKSGDKTSYSMFVEKAEGIFVPRAEVENNLGENYYKKEAKLFDIKDELGKYVYDLAYQSFVYQESKQDNKNNEFYLVVLNHDYVFDGKYDEFNKPVYGNDILRFFNLTKVVEKMREILKNDFETIVNEIKGKNPKNIEIELPNENSILVYLDNHHGFLDDKGMRHSINDLINQGIVYAKDVPNEYLHRRNNLIQKKVILTNQPYYNKRKISDGIKQLKYPVYHLDFESFNAPLPRYKGESPYTQSVFQYSIHIESSPGVCDKELDHYGYLASDHLDHRRALVESMLNVIKKDGGSVLVYNVSFERARLREFQSYFSEYHDQIEDIIKRLFDLMHIVKNNTNLYLALDYEKEEASEINFYHNDLQGSYSIKHVLPIFSELTYEGMQVSNGVDAMIAYNKFDKLSGDEFNLLYQDLVNYCKQDTWAMFEILNALRKI